MKFSNIWKEETYRLWLWATTCVKQRKTFNTFILWNNKSILSVVQYCKFWHALFYVLCRPRLQDAERLSKLSGLLPWVTPPKTNRAQLCSTSMIELVPVCPTSQNSKRLLLSVTQIHSTFKWRLNFELLHNIIHIVLHSLSEIKVIFPSVSYSYNMNAGCNLFCKTLHSCHSAAKLSSDMMLMQEKV